jgi:hypothetical protein
MLIDELLELRRELTDRGVLFCYSGYVTEPVLEGIGAALRSKLAIDRTDRQQAKNLFSIYVEQAQNLIRYSAEKERLESEAGLLELRYGILTVGKEQDGYFVLCGNMIWRQDVERLRTALEALSTMERKALTSLYKETLRRQAPKNSKGAGVGFIHIARLAVRGLDFDFFDAGDNRSFFTLKARL